MSLFSSFEIIIMSPPNESTNSRAASASIFTSRVLQYSSIQWAASLSCTRPSQNFSQVGFGKIQFVEAELPHVRRNKVRHDGVAALLSKKGFIAHENVGRAQLSRLNLRDEPLRLGKRAHQNASSTFDTRVR